VQHDFDNDGDRALLYPPKGDVTFVVVATDSGGVADVRLFDSCDPATCAPVAEANGDRSNPLDTLQLFFSPDLWNISRLHQDHAFQVVATDFSGNAARRGPLHVQAKPVPSDLTNYRDPGTIVDIKGTFESSFFNPQDPDFHYIFLADQENADLENTIGTDIHVSGAFEPEQNGFRTQLLGWVTAQDTQGVFWPWTPTEDSFGHTLQAGDQIRMVGRLRYDHQELYTSCWDTGATHAAFHSRPQGHAEIHPIDLIEDLQQSSPLPSTAHTVRWMSICNGPVIDTLLAPLAPPPDCQGLDVFANVNEQSDPAFTVRGRITAHTLSSGPAPGGGSLVHPINVHVTANKFRAKYDLWWSCAPAQPIIQSDLPMGDPLATLLATGSDHCGEDDLFLDQLAGPRVTIGRGEAKGFGVIGQFRWSCGGPSQQGVVNCPDSALWAVIERDAAPGDEFHSSCYDREPR
jgi:hypothetical protein